VLALWAVAWCAEGARVLSRLPNARLRGYQIPQVPTGIRLRDQSEEVITCEEAPLL
jgi:hypothetical protein